MPVAPRRRSPAPVFSPQSRTTQHPAPNKNTPAAQSKQLRLRLLQLNGEFREFRIPGSARREWTCVSELKEYFAQLSDPRGPPRCAIRLLKEDGIDVHEGLRRNDRRPPRDDYIVFSGRAAVGGLGLSSDSPLGGTDDTSSEEVVSEVGSVVSSGVLSGAGSPANNSDDDEGLLRNDERIPWHMLVVRPKRKKRKILDRQDVDRGGNIIGETDKIAKKVVAPPNKAKVDHAENQSLRRRGTGEFTSWSPTSMPQRSEPSKPETQQVVVSVFDVSGKHKRSSVVATESSHKRSSSVLLVDQERKRGGQRKSRSSSNSAASSSHGPVDGQGQRERKSRSSSSSSAAASSHGPVDEQGQRERKSRSSSSNSAAGASSHKQKNSNSTTTASSSFPSSLTEFSLAHLADMSGAALGAVRAWGHEWQKQQRSEGLKKVLHDAELRTKAKLYEGASAASASGRSSVRIGEAGGDRGSSVRSPHRGAEVSSRLPAPASSASLCG